MENSKIRRCPLCGGPARLKKKNRTIIQGQTTRNCYVYCPDCDIRGPRILYSDYETPYIAHEEAIERWNRRA